MRWQGRRKSDNVEDRRGISGRGLAAGGGLGGQLLNMLGVVFAGGAGSDIASIIGNILGGGVGGGVLLAIIGAIKKAVGK